MAFNSLGKVLGGADIIASVFETFNDVYKISHGIKKACYVNNKLSGKVAGVTRLELATSGLTGRRSNQTELHPQRN